MVATDRPICSSDKSLGNIYTASFLLPMRLGRFLDQLRVNRSNRAFIVRQSKLLISDSATRRRSLVQKRKRTVRHVTTARDRGPLIDDATRCLLSQFNGLSRVRSMRRLDFQMSNRHRLIRITPFRSRQKLS